MFIVAGIKLTEGASIVHATIAAEEEIVVTTTGKTIKQTVLKEYPPKGRGAQGVRCHKFLKGEDNLVQAYIGINPLAGSIELPSLSARDASGQAMDGLENITFTEK